MGEKEKMLSGSIYDPNDEELRKLRTKAHNLCLEYNKTPEDEEEKRNNILKKLGIDLGENVYLQGPIYFDYGCNISIGDNTYANFNLTILDVCPVTIGKNVFIGTGVSILTPLHPLKYAERNAYTSQKGYITDKEYGKPVEIEDNCWIASNVTILPGVKIGSGSVIGAGAVVTKDIPKNSLAFGNPARVSKVIEEDADVPIENVVIRDLHKYEIEKGLMFAWKLFLQFDSPSSTQEELDEFYNMLHDETYISQIHIIGAFAGRELIGVCASRFNGNHLSLLFVDARYQGKGIIQKLFDTIIEDCKGEKMTVYSTPYGVEICERLGFVQTGDIIKRNGISFTPMAFYKK